MIITKILSFSESNIRPSDGWIPTGPLTIFNQLINFSMYYATENNISIYCDQRSTTTPAHITMHLSLWNRYGGHIMWKKLILNVEVHCLFCWILYVTRKIFSVCYMQIRTYFLWYNQENNLVICRVHTYPIQQLYHLAIVLSVTWEQTIWWNYFQVLLPCFNVTVIRAHDVVPIACSSKDSWF